MKPARPDDWRTKSIPERSTVIGLDRKFPAEEMESIKAGLIPQAMEDKWFIYWKEDRLYFHRSWTGICLFVARFVEQDKTWKMVEAQVNRDPDQYGNTSDSRDAQLISFLIDLLLLRRPGEFPFDSANPEMNAVENWSMVGRALFGQGPKPGERPKGRTSSVPPDSPAGRPEEI